MTQQKPAPSFDKVILEALEETQKFRAIMDQETAALQDYDYGRAVKIAESKKEQASIYANAIEALSQFPQEIKNLPQTVKDKFRSEKHLFDKAAENNKLALQRGGQMTRRLSEKVISITRTSLATDGLNYGKNGMARQEQLRPMHMSVNETL